MKDLTITTVQTHLYWEDAPKSLLHFDEKLNEITLPTDIIVLPEMFTTGFTMNPKLFAEEHGGIGLQWMMKKAAEKNAVIVGSIAVKDGNAFVNRLYWVKPDTTFEYYDKRHLFSMGKEDENYARGIKRLVVEYKGWKICPLICYDLRFPVWSRNSGNNPFDVLIYIANWPEVRSYPWRHLLIGRAIENQLYVIGVNRIGEDGNAFAHSGDTAVINPKGEIISKTIAHQDACETIVLSGRYLEEFRKLFPVLNDGDEFELK